MANLLKAVCHRDTLFYSASDITHSLSAGSLTGVTASKECLLLTLFLSFGTKIASVSSQHAWYFPPTIIISWKFTFLAPTHRNLHSPAVFEFPFLKLVSDPDSYGPRPTPALRTIILRRLKAQWVFIWPFTHNYAASSFFGRKLRYQDVSRDFGGRELWHHHLRVYRN